MGPTAMPTVDVNPILGAERQALLDLLSTLTSGEFDGALSSPDVTLGIDADAATPVLSRGIPVSEVPSKLHATGSKQLGAALVHGFAALAGRP